MSQHYVSLFIPHENECYVTHSMSRTKFVFFIDMRIKLKKAKNLGKIKTEA